MNSTSRFMLIPNVTVCVYKNFKLPLSFRYAFPFSTNLKCNKPSNKNAATVALIIETLLLLSALIKETVPQQALMVSAQ